MGLRLGTEKENGDVLRRLNVILLGNKLKVFPSKPENCSRLNGVQTWARHWQLWRLSKIMSNIWKGWWCVGWEYQINKIILELMTLMFIW